MIKRLFTLSILFTFINSSFMTVFAKPIWWATPMYDPLCSTTTNTPTSEDNAGTSNAGKRVFYVGDSITVGMETQGGLLKKSNEAGLVANQARTYENRRVMGPSIEATGGIGIVDSGYRLKEHEADFKTGVVDIIVISLGTNGANNKEANTTRAADLIKYIRGVNTDAKIVWVSTNYTKGITTPSSEGNVFLKAAVQQLRDDPTSPDNNLDFYDILTGDQAIAPPDGGDGIHYGGNGYKTRSDEIISLILHDGKKPGTQTATGSTSTSACQCSTGQSQTTTTNTEEEIKPEDFPRVAWEFFLNEMRLPKNAVAGFLGNLAAESGVDPRRLDYAPGKIANEMPTETDANGVITPESKLYGDYGYGIAQWTNESHQLSFLYHSFGGGAPPFDVKRSTGDLRYQLDYIKFEFQTKYYRDVYRRLLRPDITVEDASDDIVLNYEAPRSVNPYKWDKRLSDEENFKNELQRAKDKVTSMTNRQNLSKSMLAQFESIQQSPSKVPYDPTSLAYPNFPDEQKIIQGMRDFVTEIYPGSEWLKIPNLFEDLMIEGRIRNINPLLIIGSGLIETHFGDPAGNPNSEANNNYFGINKGEKKFTTPRDGIIEFMNTISKNTSGEDPSSLYNNVRNIYEYFSVHQTGSIVYPGENMDPRDADTKPGITKDLYDESMGVWLSWTPGMNKDNPNPDRKGDYTPLIYYRVNISTINKITGLSLSAENPTKGGTTTETQTDVTNCNGPGRTVHGLKEYGTKDVAGYSFPLEPQTKRVGGIIVGQTESRHHDKTPAFDLFGFKGSAGGDKIYAIYSGTVKVGTQEEGWCYSIQLHADDDPNIEEDVGGFYYWYGHLNNLTVATGDRVEAGQMMGETAYQEDGVHTCNGTSGAGHLHIDRGCLINGEPQTGGRKACRDPNFIPFLSKIFEGLPG